MGIKPDVQMTAVTLTTPKLAIERQYELDVQVTKTDVLHYTLYHVTRPDEIAVCCQWLEQQERIGIDTETSGIDVLDHFLATIQFGNPFANDPAAFVVDFRLFTLDQLRPLLDALADPRRAKVGQNLKFEYKYLKHRANCDLRNLQDTQIAELILRAGLFPETRGGDDDAGEGQSRAYSHTSMAALCRRYFELDIDKDRDLRTSFYTTAPGTYSLRQLAYAATDVIYPFYIWEEQQKEIEARSLRSTLALELRCIPVTALAELRGMRLDTQAWRVLFQEATQKRADAERKLHQLLRNVQQQELFDSKPTEKVLYPGNKKALNFDSPLQVQWAIKTYCEAIDWPIKVVTNKNEWNKLRRTYGAEWLAKQYASKKGIPVEPETKWQEYQFITENLERVPEYLIPETQYCNLTSTNAINLRLARVKRQIPREIIDLLLEYAKYSIREDTFGNEFILKHVRSDGRVHTEFHQAKTSTGRYSTTPNLQNIPRDPRYRKCFVPAPGYKFVIADYSQQEPRLSAQCSLDPVYLATYRNDEDIYINVAEAMLGYRPDPDSPDPEFREKSQRDRQMMKTVVLAMAYRMGVNKLHKSLMLAFENEILAGKMELPTYEYVRDLHSRFLETFSKLVDYQNECSINASPSESPRPRIWDRYLNAPVTWATSRCGRKRFFPPDAQGTYTAAANSPIQGCAASMSKAAAVLIQDYIDKHGIDAGVVDMVHDELVYECREDQAAAFAKVVQQLMEKAGKFYLPDVPIKAEFPKNTNGTVDYWAKEVKLEAAA